MLTDILAARLCSLRLPRIVQGWPGCAAGHSLRDLESLEQLQHRKPSIQPHWILTRRTERNCRSPSAGAPKAPAKSPRKSPASLSSRLSRTPTPRLPRSGSSRPSTPSSTPVSLTHAQSHSTHCEREIKLTHEPRRLARQPWCLHSHRMPRPATTYLQLYPRRQG
jgi:hypothetical protein